MDVFVYDIPYGGAHASFLEPVVTAYRPLGVEGESATDWAAGVADLINADGLDVLLTIHPKPSLLDVLDRTTTPAVVNICTGSEPVNHPAVTCQVYPQPEVCFRIDDTRLRCDVTGRHVAASPVVAGWILYDDRQLIDHPRLPWSERAPVIVAHGSLYKLNSEPFLDLICGLLHDDSALDFVFLGRDRAGALAAMASRFSRESLSGRAHYEGAFDPGRNHAGSVDADGWRRAVSHLERARLAPDPWPIGGGSARVEAYLLGIPGVHMALATDRHSADERALVDLPALEVPRGTAHSVSEYRSLCQRCLYDGAFAEMLAEEQLAVARMVTNAASYWEQLRTVLSRCSSAILPKPPGEVTA